MTKTKTVKPTNLTRANVKAAIAKSKGWDEADFKAKTGYGASRTYSMLRPSGRLIPAKAIVALACKLRWKALPGENFSGGAGPGCAGTILVNLGFKVTGINAKAPKHKTA